MDTNPHSILVSRNHAKESSDQGDQVIHLGNNCIQETTFPKMKKKVILWNVSIASFSMCALCMSHPTIVTCRTILRNIIRWPQPMDHQLSNSGIIKKYTKWSHLTIVTCRCRTILRNIIRWPQPMGHQLYSVRINKDTFCIVCNI